MTISNDASRVLRSAIGWCHNGVEYAGFDGTMLTGQAGVQKLSVY